MRSNRGVTLTSVIIYVIGLSIIVALLGTFTGYFHKNLSEITMRENENEQYSRFISYITKDVNSENLIFVQTEVNGEESIIFKFGDGTEHQFIMINDKIYYIDVTAGNEKKIKLCENVSSEDGSIFSYENKQININFNIGDTKFSTTLNVNV